MSMTLKRFKKRSKAVEVYQIKVTLEGSQPPIWRRVQVASDTTLAKFHMVLQCVMGWTNSHLHQFVIRGQYFAPRDVFSEFGGPKMESETKATLADVVSGAKSRLRYEYDMGDSWRHAIVVEKVLNAEAGAHYPVCLAGARACPPEDCGGIGGYEELLEAVADPQHERHEELLEWLGGSFDPEKFDLNAVNAGLKALHRARAARA